MPPRPVLARLTSRRWSRTRRPPPPLRRGQQGAPCPTAPGGVPRERRSSSLPLPPRPRLRRRLRVRDPQLRLQRWEEPSDDLDACCRDHNHCVRKKAAWIGDMYFGFGFKWAIVEHLYQLSRISSSHGSHYDQVHSGAMMIVAEDVSSRSNRYDFDLHRKSARGTTTKETGVRLSIKTQRATMKIRSRQSSIVKRITELTESKLCIPSSVQPNGHPGDHFE